MRVIVTRGPCGTWRLVTRRVSLMAGTKPGPWFRHYPLVGIWARGRWRVLSLRLLHPGFRRWVLADRWALAAVWEAAREARALERALK